MNTAQKSLRVAAAQYPISLLHNGKQYLAKLSRWVEDAVNQGAELLVFPEYAALELASLEGVGDGLDLAEQLRRVHNRLPEYLSLHAELAKGHGVYIAAGSLPVRGADGLMRNRAHLFGPSGAHVYQDKLQMTRFEREDWEIHSGKDLSVFDTRFGRIGIALCYDAEFPLLVRRLVEQGAQLILVPSCTDGLAGYHRVRWACQARALENQCFVVQAATVGNAAWSAAVDQSVGAAAVYAPPDVGFPADGVISIGALNEPAWVYADLDFAALERVRREGQVLNHRDWGDSARWAGLPVLTGTV